MNAMCNTKQDDVKNCVLAMKEKNYKGTLIQTGTAKYSQLDKSDNRAGSAGSFMQKHETNCVINLDTERIHKKDCAHKGKNTINARIINTPATGLQVCKHCIK